MKTTTFKYFLGLLIILGLSTMMAACDDDGCPDGTEEVHDLDGNVVGCADP